MLSSLSLTGDDGIVRTRGNQTVRGVKNFIDGIITPSVTAEIGGNLNLISFGVGNVSIITDTGTNTLSSANTATNANVIEATATGGSNVMKTTSGLNGLATDSGNNYLQSTSGKNILNTSSGSNEIQINAVPKIITTSLLTTLTNTSHNINGVTTFNVNPLSATVPTTATELVNKSYADSLVDSASNVVHKTGNETIAGLKTFTDTLTANGGGGFYSGASAQVQSIGGTNLIYNDGGGNNQITNNSTGYNRLLCNGSGVNYITNDGSGKNEIFANTGNNVIFSNSGNNIIEASSGSNILQVAGNPKITTTLATNTLDNATSNILSVGGSNRLVTTAGLTTVYGETYLGYSNDDLLTRIGFNTNVAFMDFRSGGTNADYDSRIISSNGTTSIGYGDLTISSGTFLADAKTTSTFNIGGTSKITTTSATNTLANGNNEITSTGTLGNKMLSSNTNGVNRLETSGSNGINFLYSTGLSGANTITAAGASGYNSVDAQGTNAFNTIIASGANSYTSLLATGANSYNNISASGTTGYNVIDATVKNLIKVFSSTKIETTTSQTTLTNKDNTITTSDANGVNTISATGSSSRNSILASGTGGYNEMKTTAVNTGNYIDGRTTNYMNINGANIMTMNASSTTIANILQATYLDATHFLEISATVGGNLTFLDFHANTTYAVDYDARIISGGATTNANATAQITAECSSFRLSYLTGATTRAISVNTVGGIVLTVSDKRLKENITPIDTTETHLKLLKLEPKTYEWIDKENMGTGTEIGLIAQDVLEHIPELVFTTNEDMYGIHYDRIPTLLLQSVKELQRQIDELKAEITEMKNKA